MGLEFIDSFWFSWVVLPFLIFIARIFDQSAGIMRIIYATKGFKYLVPIIGFFESLIWLTAVSQIMKHLDNVMCYIAFSGGFAAGNYVGVLIEEKLSVGTVVVRVIPKKDTSELIDYLRSLGFGVTVSNVEGMSGPLKMFFTIIKRKDLQIVAEAIRKFNPNAFYTVEDIKSAKEGFFPKRLKDKMMMNK